MQIRHAILIACLALAVIPATARAETDYFVNTPLTINDPSRTLCTAIAATQETAGLAQSCGTATLSGTVNKCWEDGSGSWNCQVTFTGTMTLGPLVCGVFTSDAGTTPNQNCWPDPRAPDAPAATQTTHTRVFAGLAKGGETDASEIATFAVSPAGVGVGAVDNQTSWAPGYVFPADPTPPPSSAACSSGSANVQGASATVTVVAAPLGVAPSVTVGAPSDTDARTGPGDAEAYASTPQACT